MRPARGIASAVAALLLSVAGVGPARAGAPAGALTPARVRALAGRAYTYGYPLLEFQRVRRIATSVRCPDALGDAPLNMFSTAAGFAGPANRTVVAPNVDTLYSIAQLDLGRGPVVLSHPAMGRRYFVFELLDPYTNVIAYIGSRTTGPAAGRFAITWSAHPGRPRPGTRVVRSPYRRVWLIGRTLAGGRADQRRALALMRAYTLTPPGGRRRIAPGCRPGHPRAVTLPGGLAFLRALGVALAQSPPPRRDAPLLGALRAIGVGAGLNPARRLTSGLRTAATAGVDEAAAALPVQARLQVLGEAQRGHGWAIPSRNTGAYGTDYAYRAEVAAVGLGANTPAEAMYPIALIDSRGALLDGATRSYEITFPRGQAPPVRAAWSLTLYDAAGFLVANPLRRYAVGSSHPPLHRRRDGSTVVIVSAHRPAEAGVNWLPAPAGPFRLNLRLYWPRRAALTGRWRPPPVVPLPAP